MAELKYYWSEILATGGKHFKAFWEVLAAPQTLHLRHSLDELEWLVNTDPKAHPTQYVFTIEEIPYDFFSIKVEYDKSVRNGEQFFSRRTYFSGYEPGTIREVSYLVTTEELETEKESQRIQWQKNLRNIIVDEITKNKPYGKGGLQITMEILIHDELEMIVDIEKVTDTLFYLLDEGQVRNKRALCQAIRGLPGVGVEYLEAEGQWKHDQEEASF